MASWESPTRNYTQAAMAHDDFGRDFADLFSDHTGGHDELQIDHFILGKNHYGTDYGLYRQALRELASRTTALATQYQELELAQIDIAEMEDSIPETAYDELRADVKIKALRVQVALRQHSIRQREHEWCRFYAWARALRARIGRVTLAHKQEFWAQKLIVDAGFRMMAGQPPRWDSIFALPPTLRTTVIDALNDKPALFERLRTQTLPSIAVEIPQLSHDQVRNLVHAAISTPSLGLAARDDDAPAGGLLAAEPS